jgi:hypothetical protein
VQFQQPLAEFELVKKKIAFMAAHAFAMEATTQQCAAFIDRGAEDYMLETAILKIFATEHLWTIIFDTMQIYGGASYFTDEPLERMMRDARINTIGEGANDVLKAFVAVVESAHRPRASFGTVCVCETTRQTGEETGFHSAVGVYEVQDRAGVYSGAVFT